MDRRQLVLPPACTARTWPPESRGSLPSLHDARFCRHRIDAPALTCARISGGSYGLETIFRSPTGSARFPGRPGGVSAPDLFLQPSAERWINPFGPKTPLLDIAVSGSSGRLIVFEPVAYPITSGSPEPFPARRSPSGVLPPSGSKRPNRSQSGSLPWT